MKLFRATLILAVVVIAIFAILYAVGWVDQSQAFDYGGRALAVVVILGFALSGISLLAGRGKTSSSETKPQGPKFD